MGFDLNAGRGAEVAQQEASKAKGGFEQVHYFPTLKDGEVVYIRMLTDAPEWLSFRQHSMVPTKPRPSNWTSQNYPEKMSATCRKQAPFSRECFIDEFMKKPDGKPYTAPSRTWAKACMREEVIGTQDLVDAGKIQPHQVGTRVGFKDKLREVAKVGPDGKPTGEKVQEKAVVLINMGWDNFFSRLAGAAAPGAYGTCLDRDFMVRRMGTGLDTDYQIMSMDPTPGWDVRDPKVAATYGEVVKSQVPGRKNVDVISTKEIEEIIIERASDDFYATFFDTRVEAPARKKSDGDSQVSTDKPSGDMPAPPPVTDQDDNAHLAMMEAVRGYSQQSTPTDGGSPASTGGMANFG